MCPYSQSKKAVKSNTIKSMDPLEDLQEVLTLMFKINCNEFCFKKLDEVSKR